MPDLERVESDRRRRDGDGVLELGARRAAELRGDRVNARGLFSGREETRKRDELDGFRIEWLGRKRLAAERRENGLIVRN